MTEQSTEETGEHRDRPHRQQGTKRDTRLTDTGEVEHLEEQAGHRQQPHQRMGQTSPHIADVMAEQGQQQQHDEPADAQAHFSDREGGRASGAQSLGGATRRKEGSCTRRHGDGCPR